MEFLILVAVVLVFLPLGLAIAAWVRVGALRNLVDPLVSRIIALEREVRELRRQRSTELASKPAAAPVLEPAAAPVEAPLRVPSPAQPPPMPREMREPAPAREASAPAMTAPEPTREAPARGIQPIDWEQFMGAKLFAWIGGLALFLGIVFLVKYSFERDLIPPEMRVAMGFLAGLGLLAGGVMMQRKAYAVTSQTLCATGVLVLYATTYACHGFYHFPFFGLAPTLLLMTLITAVAFFLAVRLNAQVVAVLGMAGGFLTPVLLSTGHDNPFGLFGYVALIDAGLLAVALHRRWHYLVPLGAAGTVLMLLAWAGRFFVAEQYFAGNKVLIPIAVLIGLEALFLAGAFQAKRRGQLSREISGSVLALAFAGFCFAIYFLSFGSLALRPILLFGYVFIIDLCVLALVLLDEDSATAQPVSGLLVFALLAGWTGKWMNEALLNSALALYLLFTVFHTVAPLALQRLRATAAPAWWSQAFPVFALLLIAGPLLQTTALSFLIWPFVLLVDVLAVALAIFSGALLPILFALVLTLAVIGTAIAQVPATLIGLSTSLWMIGLFAVFFLVASVWAIRRFAQPAGGETAGHQLIPAFPGSATPPENLTALLPACSVVLPFLLLIMVTARLPIADPSPVFGLALLLVVLLLGLTRVLKVEVVPLVGLLATLALEHAWHFRHFDPAHATLPLTWYLGFYAIFTVFPFVFRRDFRRATLPWAAAALAGPLHFHLIHRLVEAAWPNSMMGLVPAAFAVPSLLGLMALLKSTPESGARNSQLAWFGGVALFFITLIFPIQFERQWITIGWALEGVALCWLFQRVPHSGLRVVGVALLVTAFARLALNPAVFGYHPRSAAAIFNWYLYAYGIVTACLFAGARLLAPPRHRVLGYNIPPLLYALGTVLAFLLVNIEIADYFTPPGTPVVTLQFSGNLARDMSYSIAWSLFALLLVIIGIRRKLAPVRYAGIGLLSVTLLKLFFHDLSQLGQLYRI
ncbi:MAG: DUF2339 domain-containing protein, partial [Verrucomicrobiota bacterium]|nr:DUF2339 domain-containing protein [Verrucomicrobiota bacterium]